MGWSNLPIEKRKQLAAEIAAKRKKNGSYKQSKDSIEKMIHTSRERGLYESDRMKRLPKNRNHNEDEETAKRRRLDARITYRQEKKTVIKTETGDYVEKTVIKETTIIRRKGTWPERTVEDLFQLIGLKEGTDYKKQYDIGMCQVDFYLPKHNLVIEVNGCWPHQCGSCGFDKGAFGKSVTAIRERDSERIKYLESKGYLTHTIWGHELKQT